MATATAALSRSGKDEHMAKTDMAMASAAILVAAQCVEAAEAMEAEREHLVTVVNSAMNVWSAGDIMTLTTAAATHGASLPNRCTFGNGTVEMEACVMDDKKRCGAVSELTIINRPR
ncbi:hypothetical protein EV1_019122 [Malus domestica]